MHQYRRVNNDIRKRLSKALIFRYIDESRMEEILSRAKVTEYGESEEIIKEGEESTSIYLVLNGEVSVTVEDGSGETVYLCTIGEGEIFGEAGIFLRTARTANVLSLGKSRILELDRSDLLQFIKKDPSAGIKVLMIIIYGLLRKLRETNQELAYERKTDMGQEDIDDLVESLLKD
jgi:CRP/FNR family cyclic AMP-dependent transcriptional regulator